MQQSLFKKTLGILLCLGVITAMLNSCVDENFWRPIGVPPTTNNSIKVTSITIYPEEGVSIEVGKTTTLTVTVAPDNATNKNVLWSSLNTNIATVDEQTGVVTGLSGGTATIRATADDDSGVIANKNITVTQSELSVSSESYNFAASGGTSSPIIVTSNQSWTISSSASWLTTSLTSGSNNNTFTMTATANTVTSSRSASVTIIGGGITRIISVTQDEISDLSVTPTSYNFAASGGTSSPITITSNQSWTISSSAWWLTTSLTSGSNTNTFIMTAMANTAASSRSATITVSGGGITRTVSVTQDEVSDLSVMPTSYNFAASGGTSPAITVTSNTSWTVSSDAAWLTTSLTSGNNNNTFTMTAAENTATSSRSATITVTGNGITRTVSVTQDAVAATLTVSPDSYNFTASGGTSSAITVTSNHSWTVSSDAAWLTTSLSSGNNNNTFTMTATENTVASLRSATITVTGGGITKTINVTQAAAAATLDVSPLTWNPVAGGGTSSAITVTSNASWTVSSNAAWLTTSLSGGSNNNTFTMTATANTATSSRSATVTVTGGGITKTINITQAAAAATLEVSPLTWNPVAGGGTSSAITVTSNTYWAVSSNAAWLTTSLSSGSNNNTFTMTATANTVMSSRSATVTVTGGGITKTINITQDAAAATLDVSPLTWNPGAGGGTSSAITVTSNTSWTVSSNAAWLTTSLSNGSSNNTFTMTATANTATSSRSASVTVTSGGITKTINVIQAAVILDVSPLTWNPAANGGISPAIIVTSNTSWTVSSNAAWLTTSLSNGNNTNLFTMTATENLASSSRSASVTVTGGGITRTISVTQAVVPIGGVVINGVIWATRNVDKPGTFTATSEAAGMLYQWNRKIGWSVTDPKINSNGGTTWDSSVPVGTTWEKANDPSPAGWRLPTLEEFQKLCDTDKVTNVWTTQNGVTGRKFTDKTSGNVIFLPVAGYREGNDGTLDYAGSYGYYWSSTAVGNYDYSAYYLYFYSDGAYWYGWDGRYYGRSVRAVAE